MAAPIDPLDPNELSAPESTSHPNSYSSTGRDSDRLRQYLQAYMARVGIPRAGFVHQLAQLLNTDTEVVNAVLDGLLPDTEIDAELLTVIAELTNQDSNAGLLGELLASRLVLSRSKSSSGSLLRNRYELLEVIGVGSTGQVYRAHDRLSGQIVALKRPVSLAGIVRATDRQTPSKRYEQAQEFSLLASLRHPNIISVIDYGFDDSLNPYFTMELLESHRTIVDAASEAPLETKIDLLLQLFRALVYLHRWGILHRDLKPANVLVRGNQVKVVDFGLASLRAEADGIVGSLKWIAPEILAGHHATAASDLYSGGMIAYEVITGRYPFEIEASYALTRAILTEKPILPTIQDHPHLATIIDKLIAKKPSQRYASAEEALAALESLTNLAESSLSLSMRGRFIQTAPLVGREVELNVLKESLGHLSHGEGSAWLVCGESGIGKSRLLAELGILALTQGALVLRGNAVSNGQYLCQYGKMGF